MSTEARAGRNSMEIRAVQAKGREEEPPDREADASQRKRKPSETYTKRGADRKKPVSLNKEAEGI